MMITSSVTLGFARNNSITLWSRSSSLYGVVHEQGTTSYLAPFPCDCQNRGEGREDEEGGERLGRLDPKIWAEKSKFQDLVLCSSDCPTETRQIEPDGLVALQERLEDPASAVNAPTTA